MLGLGTAIEPWWTCLGKKMLLSTKKGVPGAHCTVLLLYLLWIYWTFYSFFLLFSFLLSNTGNVALEYTWMAAMEDERAVSHTGELLPPSLDGKALALWQLGVFQLVAGGLGRRPCHFTPKHELLFHPCPFIHFHRHLCSLETFSWPWPCLPDPPVLALTLVLCTGAEPGSGQSHAAGSGLGKGDIRAALWGSP